MSKADALVEIGRLATAFGQAITAERAALYAEQIQDISQPLLAASVNALLSSAKFFPAISEIRQTAARIAGVLAADPAEAMALVRRADVSRPVFRRDGTFAYTEREWDWSQIEHPATLELIRDTLERVGEPQDGEGKSYFGWEMGFQKTYETAAEPVNRLALADLSRAQLPPHKLKQLGDGQ